MRRVTLLIALVLLVLGATRALAREAPAAQGGQTAGDALIKPTLSTPRPTLAATATPTLAPTATPTSEEEATPHATAVPSETAVETPETSPEPEATPAAAPAGSATPAAPRQVELTVYNQNRALVREVRTFALEAGGNLVRYGRVPVQILPASLRVRSLTDPVGTWLLEQTYQYDTADSYSVLSRYLNQEITLKTREGSAYTGKLLSLSGDVVLGTTRGIVIVKADQVQEYALPALAGGLVSEPSLLWRLHADQAGDHELQVTYLTEGMNWSAEYAAVLSSEETTLALESWVTLDNQSGASYEDAKLKLVAGSLNVATTRAYRAPSEAYYTNNKQVEQPAVGALLDYHVYRMQLPVTIRDGQSKQVAFTSAPAVAVRKVYVYDASPAFALSAGQANTDPRFGVQSSTPVQVRLEFSNTVASGLGVPLPAGIVRVYAQDEDGVLALVGEDSMGHTAVGEQLALNLGQAFDVLAERVPVKYEQLAERSIQETTRITLRNRKEQDVVVRVIEHLFRAEDAEVMSSSENYTIVDAHTIQFEVKVAGGATATVEYTTRYRW